MTKVMIKKGGLLWDTERKNDVTPFATRFLFYACEIEKGVTLKDVFLLLQRDITFYNVLFGNWVDELVAEGLKGSPGGRDHEIEYLELYWCLESWKFDGERTLEGMMFPDFHGVGFEQPKDKYAEGTDIIECKKGDRIHWAIEFTPCNELINIEIRLRDRVDISLHKEKSGFKEFSYDKGEFSFAHILYGIIWELSFMGSPADRNKAAQDLRDTSERIRNGTEPLVKFKDADDLLNSLEEEE